jgi:hypothetical protein
MRLWCHRPQKFRQAWNQAFPIWLMHPILHSFINHIRIRWALPKTRSKQRHPLQIEYQVFPRIHGRQDFPGFCGRDFKIWYYSYAFYFWCPFELLVVADVERRCGWLESSVYAASGFGEDFAEGNFYAFAVFWIQIIEVCSDQTAVKSCCYTVNGVSMFAKTVETVGKSYLSGCRSIIKQKS